MPRLTLIPWRQLTLAFVLVAFAPGRHLAATSTPFAGAPVALPGTVLAANFDTGGPGIAYGETTAGNSGGAYRTTYVDLELGSEGLYDVGWITPTEWLNYSVIVSTS